MVEKWKSYDDKFKIFIVKAKHAKSVIKKKKKPVNFSKPCKHQVTRTMKF